MADKKDTNPKDAIGIAKVPHSTLSAQVMGEVGLAMMEGALKYGRHNYRLAGVRASVYKDALDRHLGAWWEGQDIDPKSGLSHVTKAIACLMVLRDSMLQENWVDDRPPKAKNQNWVEDLNAKAKALLEMYPNPVPACTEINHKASDVVEKFFVDNPEVASEKCGDHYVSLGHDRKTCQLVKGHEGRHSDGDSSWWYETTHRMALGQQLSPVKVSLGGAFDSTGTPNPQFYYTYGTFNDDGK